jgi:exodeoxyribonuclease VII small subunit
VTEGDALSYEQARDELVGVVKKLEAGGLTLQQSLELWERGEKLAAICSQWLEGARARLTAAMAARTESASTGPAGEGAGPDGNGEGNGESREDGKAPF